MTPEIPSGVSDILNLIQFAVRPFILFLNPASKLTPATEDSGISRYFPQVRGASPAILEPYFPLKLFFCLFYV
jgi:hypothetical protein